MQDVIVEVLKENELFATRPYEGLLKVPEPGTYK